MATNAIVPPQSNNEEEIRRWREELCTILNETKETAESGGSSSTPFTADTPETPTGISATGGFGVIVIAWTAASYTGHSYTEIWASTTDDIGTATPVGSSFTNTFTHPIASPATSTVYYYWIRHINANYEGGAFSAASVNATVDNSATYSLELLVGSLGYDQFAPGTVPIRNVDPLPTLPDADYPVGSVVFLTTDGKLYRNVSNIWNKDVDGADLTANSIVAGKIAAGAIVADAVGTNEIIASAANIGNGVITSAKIGTGEIKTANIADANITNAKIDRASANKLVVVTADIADANITSAKIANLAVDSAKIANAAITEAKIGSAAITEAKIGSLAVSTLKIQDNAVTVSVGASGSSGTNVTLDSLGQPVMVISSVTFAGFDYSGATNHTWSITIQRDTTTIKTYSGVVWGEVDINIPAQKYDVPATGNRTYTITGTNSSSASMSVELLCVGLKK